MVHMGTYWLSSCPNQQTKELMNTVAAFQAGQRLFVTLSEKSKKSVAMIFQYLSEPAAQKAFTAATPLKMRWHIRFCSKTLVPIFCTFPTEFQFSPITLTMALIFLTLILFVLKVLIYLK